MAQKCKIHMMRNDNQVVEAEIEGLDAETAGAEAGAAAGATAGATAGAEAGSTALASISGYDAAKVQVLTNDNGTLKWVDNT